MKPISKKLTAFILISTLFLGLFLVSNIVKGQAFPSAPPSPGEIRDIPKNIGDQEISETLENQNRASEDQDCNLACQIASGILKKVGNLFLTAAKYLLGKTATLFNYAIDSSAEILESSVVHDGWAITRDIVNMFFILGLVVIAFATILRMETYGMKALLPKIVIIALSINFSFLVCGIIIDATHITTDFFVNGIRNLSESKDIGVIIYDEALRIRTSAPEESIPEFQKQSPLFAIVSIFYVAFTVGLVALILLIGTILLIIRAAALSVLLILVPFAWFFSIFPALKGMSSKWWNNFLKYAFFAPIFVFFLYLAIKLAMALHLPKNPYLENASDGFKLFMAQTFEYAIVIIILFGAPIVAMSMGIYGSQAIMGAAKGAFKGTVRGVGRGLRMAALAPPGWMRKVPGLKQLAAVTRKVAPYTVPEFWKKALEARKIERLRKAGVGRAIGNMQDLTNRVYSLFTEKTHHAERAGQFEVEEEKKDLILETKRNSGRLTHAYEDARKKKQKSRMKAALELLVEQKDHNDLMLFSDQFDEMRYSDKAGDDIHGQPLAGRRINPTGKEKDRKYSNVAFKDAIYQQFKEAGASEKETNYLMAGLSEVGLRSGAYGLFGMTKGDSKGNLVRTSDQEQGEIAAAKYNAVTLRDKSRHEHATTFVKQTWDKEREQYGYGGIDEIGQYILQTPSKGDISSKRFYEMREDTTRLTGEAYDDVVEVSKKWDAAGAASAVGITKVANVYTREGRKAAEKAAAAITGIKQEVKKEVKKAAEEVRKTTKEEAEKTLKKEFKKLKERET